MRKQVIILSAVTLFAAVPAFADHVKDKAVHQGIQECAIQAESIQQKIKRVQDEISKGSTKYSLDDIKKLEAKLKELNDQLEILGKR